MFEEYGHAQTMWENVTMIDSLELIVSCGLEFGLNSKLTNKMKDYE